MRIEDHKLVPTEGNDFVSPENVIKWVEWRYPETKDMCFFDKESKRLGSRDEAKFDFYFDPFHSVIRIMFINQEQPI